MNVGSICSGVGGLDLAVETHYRARTVWHAEVDRHASAVLAERWPGVPNLGDITIIDWAAAEPVDVICGGTPCQDLSTAGERAGMTPGTRSGLWASMARAVEIIRPTAVVWENVSGALSARAASDMELGPGLLGGSSGGPVLRAAGRVVGDLASLGYDAQWATVPASAVGACHRRERLFVVARPAPDADLGRREGEPWAPPGRVVVRAEVGCDPDRCSNAAPPDAGRERHGGGQGDRVVGRVDGENASRARQRQRSRSVPGDRGDTTSWGRYTAAVERWGHVLGRPVPAPTDDRGRLNPRLAEWMMGLPDGWVCDILDRRLALRCIGNGCVPQQALHALQLLDPALEVAS